MTGMLDDLSVWMLVLSLLVVGLAGFVKGAVGFAMPMILISGIGSFLPAEVAIAALILPTVITNLRQALRNGVWQAFESFRKFWRFNLVLFVTIALAAQLVTVLPGQALFVILGVPVVGFALVQLWGWVPVVRDAHRRAFELGAALVAGFFGGLTGVWGPPTILYLTTMNLPKSESVRVQGVMYLLGSFLLLGAHLKSGVLNSETIPYSALLVVPALLGQYWGIRMHDRMDQALFRRATLFVLVIAGLNLVRRGLFG